MQITDRGGYVAFDSPDGQTLYYTKTSDGSSPLFGRSLAGGPEHEVLRSVYNRAFSVASTGIYFVEDAGPDGKFPLMLFDFATRKTRLLTVIDGVLEQGLTVTPDGRTVIYVLNSQRAADLELVDNFR